MECTVIDRNAYGSSERNDRRCTEGGMIGGGSQAMSLGSRWELTRDGRGRAGGSTQARPGPRAAGGEGAQRGLWRARSGCFVAELTQGLPSPSSSASPFPALHDRLPGSRLRSDGLLLPSSLPLMHIPLCCTPPVPRFAFASFSGFSASPVFRAPMALLLPFPALLVFVGLAFFRFDVVPCWFLVVP